MQGVVDTSHTTAGWLIALLQNQTALNALGAAAGGFFGVILFFLVRLLIEKIRARPTEIRRYSCAHNQNVGDAKEYEGQLMHHHGHRVGDARELKTIGAKDPVWEWSRTPCGKDQGSSLIYGPYTTDFSEPGEYEIAFMTRAYGLSAKSELSHDPVVLEFDVTRTTPQFLPTAEGIATFGGIMSVCRHFVRASDLATGGWVKVPLRFHATGEGVWEYRIHAYDGVSKKPDNLAHFGGNVRLFFAWIIISRVRRMSVPWA